MKDKIGIVILAAGAGKRLGADRPKPLVPIWGKPMISHLLDQMPQGITPYIIISPKDEKSFKKHLGQQKYLFQSTQNGTATAVRQNLDSFDKHSHLIVLNGDTPFVPQDLMLKLIQSTKDNIIVCFRPTECAQYGQVVTKDEQAVQIVEFKDRTNNISTLCYSGMMKCSISRLKQLIELPPSPITNEYYITDLISITNPFDIIEYPTHYLSGINTLNDLEQVPRLFHLSRLPHFISHGVFFEDYHRVTIHPSVQIKPSCYIASGVSLLGKTVIGAHSIIHQGCIVRNSIIGQHATLHPYTVVSDSLCRNQTTLGPFAHICEQSDINHHAHIGNFVEVKRSRIGAFTKAKHLSYLGDAHIGERCNIGAGVITCNYVPWAPKKQMTQIHNSAFIGAGTLLIAPVIIGKYSLCAAGSVITKPVPEQTLAISRPELTMKVKHPSHKWGT